MTELSRALSSQLASVDEWPVKSVCAAARGADGQWVVHGDDSRVYGLASVTKLLSAHAMLVAVEEGVFELDDELEPTDTDVSEFDTDVQTSLTVAGFTCGYTDG